MINMANAQNSTNIVGTYNIEGSYLIVLENGNYAIMYFGGIQTGKWKFTKDTDYKFTPNIKESKFELFGRYNKDLKDSTKIAFNGFENSETFIQLRTTKKEEYTMKRVFNIDANCISFPNVHTFQTTANSISFAYKVYEEKSSPIVTFKNSERYNDFVVNFIEINSFEGQPFFATFKNDTLSIKNDYSQDNDYSQRKPFDEDDEDIEFVRTFIEKEANRDTIYFNPSYNMFGGLDDEENQDIHDHHVFNKQKNAFINTQYYVEGEEYIKSDDSFDNMSIIYAYTILKEYTKEPEKFKINEKPIFQVNCD